MIKNENKNSIFEANGLKLNSVIFSCIHLYFVSNVSKYTVHQWETEKLGSGETTQQLYSCLQIQFKHNWFRSFRFSLLITTKPCWKQGLLTETKQYETELEKGNKLATSRIALLTHYWYHQTEIFPALLWYISETNSEKQQALCPAGTKRAHFQVAKSLIFTSSL